MLRLPSFCSGNDDDDDGDDGDDEDDADDDEGGKKTIDKDD